MIMQLRTEAAVDSGVRNMPNDPMSAGLPAQKDVPSPTGL